MSIIIPKWEKLLHEILYFNVWKPQDYIVDILFDKKPVGLHDECYPRNHYVINTETKTTSL